MTCTARAFGNLVWIFSLLFFIAQPLPVKAQESWRYPFISGSEKSYVATNFMGTKSTDNPITTVVASYMETSGLAVKFVRQNGDIAYQNAYKSDCNYMYPLAITAKKGTAVIDSRYAIVGTARDCSGGDGYNMWLLELDDQGAIMMMRVYDVKINALAGGASYYPAAAYAQNATVPMDIKPVYEDPTGAKGYIVTGYVAEQMGSDVPFDVVPPLNMSQSRRQSFFLRLSDNGSILWNRSIETAGVNGNRHHYTMVNKIVELPGKGFAYTGQAIQHDTLGGSAGVPGGILSGGISYSPPTIVGLPATAHITHVAENITPGACGADPANAVFMASGDDLLFDAPGGKLHLLGSGLQLQGPCCSLDFGRPYLIVGEIDPGNYALNIPSMRLLDFMAIPTSPAATDRPAIVGARIFQDPQDANILVQTGYLHNSVFTDNNGLAGSHPFYLKYNTGTKSVVGNQATVFPHYSENYYQYYHTNRTFSPLNYYNNPAGISDVLIDGDLYLHAFAPYTIDPGIFHMVNNVVNTQSAPANTCFKFTTEVDTVPGNCPPFLELPKFGLPNYGVFYTSSTAVYLETPLIMKSGLPNTSVGCAAEPFRPVATPESAQGTFRQQASNIHPNPAKNEIQITVPEPAVYSIQNATGKTVLSGVLSAGGQKLGIGSLPAGLYLIRIQAGNHAPEFHKLVKE